MAVIFISVMQENKHLTFEDNSFKCIKFGSYT